MKKIKLAIATVLLSIPFFISAQKVYTSADVFTQKQVIWYGLDFSLCKFIGNPAIHDRGYKSPQIVAKYYFGDWNSIPMTEAPKYDVKGALDKDNMVNDVSSVEERNRKYNPDSLITLASEYKLNTALIPDAIKTYNGLAKEGIGVCYFVECFDHIKEIGSYYVVIFDIASKKILFMDRVTGKPAGANLKTYWAGSFREAVAETSKLYKTWKKSAKIK
jgi:hypothetical protein